jgi:predicted nucleotidyltransferase
MGTIPKPIQEIIEDYVRKIGSQIPVEKAILFGSYAKGTYTADSDIDLAIFSDYFAQAEKIEGFRFLFLQAMNYGIDLQPQPFTVQDFREPVGIVEEIVKSGIEIPLQ